jgi:hypothetical protein
MGYERGGPTQWSLDSVFILLPVIFSLDLIKGVEHKVVVHLLMLFMPLGLFRLKESGSDKFQTSSRSSDCPLEENDNRVE